MISNGLRCLSSSLRILTTLDSVTLKGNPYHSNFGPGFSEALDLVIICEEIPDIKAELGEFLLSLDELSFLYVMDGPYVFGRSDAYPASVLHIFYGILLLLLIRISLEAILRHVIGEYAPFGHQANQDLSFERGWDCPLYQPMLYVLRCSMLSFHEAQQQLNSDSALDEQYERAASLFPVSKDSLILEHVAYFFERCYPSSTSNSRPEVGRADVLVQLAQLEVLSRGGIER